MASKFFCTITSPFFPYVLRIESLILAIASSRLKMPAMAKKQVLHYGVDPSTHSRRLGHLDGIDYIKAKLFFVRSLFGLQTGDDARLLQGHKDCSTGKSRGRCCLEHVVTLQEAKLMDKSMKFAELISDRGADWIRPLKRR